MAVLGVQGLQASRGRPTALRLLQCLSATPVQRFAPRRPRQPAVGGILVGPTAAMVPQTHTRHHPVRYPTARQITACRSHHTAHSTLSSRSARRWRVRPRRSACSAQQIRTTRRVSTHRLLSCMTSSRHRPRAVARPTQQDSRNRSSSRIRGRLLSAAPQSPKSASAWLCRSRGGIRCAPASSCPSTNL